MSNQAKIDSAPSLLEDSLLAQVKVVRGHRMLGPVVLRRLIGQGGMGRVYHGQHLNLGIDVAVKCLLPHVLQGSPDLASRFRREAMLTASINHPSLIRVYDVEEHEGLHYFIMELVPGENLRGRVKRRGAEGVREALTIIIRAAAGLAAAHEMGVIHRDIKPDNILVRPDGVVKLADLGLAKATISTDSLATSSHLVMGTPQYMPAEQFDGAADVGPQADVYSLGATLAFLLTGTDAHQGSLSEIMARVCLEPFPDPRVKIRDLPEEVADLVARATAREPEDRPADAGAFAVEARRVLESLGGEVDLADPEAPQSMVLSPLSPSIIKEIRAAQASAAVPIPGTEVATDIPATLRRLAGFRKPWHLPAAAIALLLTILGSTLLIGGGGSDSGTPPSLSPADLDARLQDLGRMLEKRVTRAGALSELEDLNTTHPGDEKVTSLLVYGYRESARDCDRDGSFSEGLVQARKAFGLKEDETSRRLIASLEQKVKQGLEAGLVIDPDLPGSLHADGQIRVSGTLSYSGVEGVRVDGQRASRHGDVFEHTLQLADGVHTIKVVAFDENGMEVKRPLELQVDSQKPSITARLARKKPRMPRNVSVDVRIEDQTPVTVTIEDGRSFTWKPSEPGLSIPFSLEGGHQVIRLLAHDAAGNDAQAEVHVDVDATDPVLTVELEDGPHLISKDRFDLVASATDLEGEVRIAATLDGMPIANAARGTLRATLNLPEDRSYQLEILAADLVGNQARRRVEIVRDATSPIVRLDGALSRTVKPGDITIAGRVEDEHPGSVQIDDHERSLQGQSFRETLHLETPGRVCVVLRARDLAGNDSDPVTVTFDVLRPCRDCATTGRCQSCGGSARQTRTCKLCEGKGTLFSKCSICDGTNLARCVACRGVGELVPACNNCQGSGWAPCGVCGIIGAIIKGKCFVCSGNRKVPCSKCKQSGRLASQDCPSCQGGFVRGTTCHHCQSGYTSQPCGTCRGQPITVACSACRGTTQCPTCKGEGYLPK